MGCNNFLICLSTYVIVLRDVFGAAYDERLCMAWILDGTSQWAFFGGSWKLITSKMALGLIVFLSLI